MQYLLNFPLLLLLAIVPFAGLAAFLLQNRTQPGRPLASAPLIVTACIILAVATGAHLVFALLYLLSPALSDHIEPTTAIVAWIYAQGGQIYHALDAPERYSFLYGPVPYVATAWIYQLFGTGVLEAKLAGFICLLLSFTLLALSVRQRFRNQIVPYLVALGYFSLLALFFKNHSFWSKPDSFMIAAAALGLYSCLLRPGRIAWLLCGIALGIAVNAKVTGAVYFLPYLAWFLDRDGYRAPLVILPAAAVVALLPFLSAEKASLLNYLLLLQSAGDHGFSALLLLQNLVFLAFLLAPVIFFLAWQFASVGVRNWLVRRKLVSAAAIAAALLILVAGSKPGSGAHHFLPFLPALALLTTYAVTTVYAYRPTTRWCVYGFWTPLAAFLLAAVIKTGVALYYGLGVVMAQANETVVADEVAAIMAAHPDQNIYMGYGDGGRYVSTFLRTDLAFAGEPYLIDLPAILDFEFSGISIPDATIDKMLADRSSVWLIPAGEKPFAMVSYYRKQSGGLAFDEKFRSAFRQNFVKSQSGQYFDIYTYKQPESASP